MLDVTLPEGASDSLLGGLLGQATFEKLRCVFEKHRFEKRKTHDVVPVGMGEDEMIVETAFFNQAVAQAADAGPGVHDNDIVTFRSNFNTGGVPAVFQVLRPGKLRSA